MRMPRPVRFCQPTGQKWRRIRTEPDYLDQSVRRRVAPRSSHLPAPLGFLSSHSAVGSPRTDEKKMYCVSSLRPAIYHHSPCAHGGLRRLQPFPTAPHSLPAVPWSFSAPPRAMPSSELKAAHDQGPSKEAKLWGGRFEDSVTDAVERFSESVSFDKDLYKQDIMGSRAHAQMLAHQVRGVS